MVQRGWVTCPGSHSRSAVQMDCEHTMHTVDPRASRSHCFWSVFLLIASDGYFTHVHMEAIDSFSGRCLKHAIVFKLKTKKYLAHILQSEMGKWKKVPLSPWHGVWWGWGSLLQCPTAQTSRAAYRREDCGAPTPQQSLGVMFTAPEAPVAVWCRVLLS